MKVIVDTNVWSVALRRRRATSREAAVLRVLIEDGRAQLLGPIRQELLTGTREGAEFDRLKRLLSSFEDLQIITSDYVEAARFANICRKRGIQGSTIDFLICACAAERSMPIFTMDKDFVRFSRYLPIELFSAADRP